MELSLNASFPCQVIDYDKMILNKAITSSEEYMIKKYIPKKCVEAPLDCKELAKNTKKAINHLTKVYNYASPKVILAVYCKGESVGIIPKIIAPARQIDAIILNLQQRVYLTGQIEQMYNSKSELQNQLSYNKQNIGDFARDGYFVIKEVEDFLHKKAIQAINFASKFTKFLGIDISDAIMNEPQYWSQKLNNVRDLSSQQITEIDLSSSDSYSYENSKKSIEKLNRLRTRNEILTEEIQFELGDLWTDWYILYLNSLIYDYDTFHISIAEQAQKDLALGISQHEAYQFNTAYKTLNKSKTKLFEATAAIVNAESNKKISFIKVALWIICIRFFLCQYKNNHSSF